jgi:hypothetical protein
MENKKLTEEQIKEIILKDNIIVQSQKFNGKIIKNFNWLIDEDNKQHFIIEFDSDEDKYFTIFIKDDNTFDFTFDYTIENNKLNKNIIKKLSKLPYISLKNTPRLDNIEILYIDEKVSEEQPNVFSRYLSVGVYETDKLENVSLLVEKLFIDKVKNINKIEYIENNDMLLTIKKHLNNIYLERTQVRKRKSGDIFLLAPKGFVIDEYDIIETEFLENEIIFGYKTEIDEPGLVLISNEEGLKDKNNIRLQVYDIGFYPQKSYCLLNIK